MGDPDLRSILWLIVVIIVIALLFKILLGVL